MAKIFEDHIYGTENYIPTLKTALEVVSIELHEKKNPNLSAQYFGFVAVKENKKIIIKKMYPVGDCFVKNDSSKIIGKRNQ